MDVNRRSTQLLGNDEPENEQILSDVFDGYVAEYEQIEDILVQTDNVQLTEYKENKILNILKNIFNKIKSIFQK